MMFKLKVNLTDYTLATYADIKLLACAIISKHANDVTLEKTKRHIKSIDLSNEQFTQMQALYYYKIINR